MRLGSVPRHHSSDLHSSPVAQQSALCPSGKTQAACRCSQGDLSGAQRKGSRHCLAGICRRTLRDCIPSDRQNVAEKLGVHHPVFLLLAGGAHTDVHHQCRRECQLGSAQGGAQGGAQSRPLPQRDISHQIRVYDARTAMDKWTMPVRGWASAKIQLAIQFGDEFDIQD